MRSVVLEGPGTIMVKSGPEPVPADGAAVVRPRWNGVCGSDLAAFLGKAPQVTYPRVLGHEILVDVVSCPGRPELEGRRAVVEPLTTCGTCRACRLGRGNCCSRLRVLGVQADGGLADQFSVEPRRLHAVPDGLPDEAAILTEPTSVALHAVQRSSVDPGELVVVFGAGTIGLLIMQILLRARGCRVLTVDVDPWRLEVAAELGATTVDGSEPDAVRRLTEQLTKGEMAAVVFEATGNPACTAQTTELVAAAGTIVLVGWNQGPVPIDTITLMRREVDLLGSRATTGVFPNVLQLLDSGAVDYQAMVTHRVDIAEAEHAFHLLRDPASKAIKVIIGNLGTSR